MALVSFAFPPFPILEAFVDRLAELEDQWLDLSIATTDARPCINLFPAISQEGDKVRLLFGEIQSKHSIVGLGTTLVEAADAFDKDFYSKHPRNGACP